MSPNPTLLFDFDGTIADTLPALIEVYNNSIAKTFFCKTISRSGLTVQRDKISKGQRVLIIDDDQQLRQMLCRILQGLW